MNFGPPSSGSFLTASLVFEELGIEVDIRDDDYQVALDKLRQGEIDAWVRVDAKPTLLLEELTAGGGVHLLSIPSQAITGSYVAARLSPSDYPALVADGQVIDTLAVPTAMAVYAWSRRHEKRAQLERFFSDLTKNLDRLQTPAFHPKWQGLDLEADIPGWQRF